MKRDDEDFPDWLQKMIDEGHTLYDNDYSDHYHEELMYEDTEIDDDVIIEELDDDEFYVTIVAELYDKSDDFICEIEREDVGILYQDQLDDMVERVGSDDYIELVQKDVFDQLKYKVLDVYLLFERRSHDTMIIYFQHKVDKL